MRSKKLRIILSGCILTLPVAVRAQSAEPPWAGYLVIDMTHSFGAETIYWPTEGDFSLEVGFEGVTDAGFYYTSNRFSAADHGGTHLDAPKHFARGKQAADEVPLARLMGPACVIDISEAALADSDYRLSVGDISAWEAENGRIESGCIVLLNTGYAGFWPNRERYLGTNLLGAEGVANLHFPGYSVESARLLAERAVAAVGIDTASIDYGQSQDFAVHRHLYDLEIPGFENVTNVDALPPTGAYVTASRRGL
jgi:kynurenine formamidase